jgi:tRNA U34 2-thiouridine synthase MnmA/TrmU
VTQTGDVWRIELDEPAYGVAPGQSAVLYQGDLVAAAGIIGNAIGDVP